MIPKKVNTDYMCRHFIKRSNVSECKEPKGGIKSIRVMSLEEASKEFPDIEFGTTVNMVSDPIDLELYRVKNPDIKLEEYDNEAPI